MKNSIPTRSGHAMALPKLVSSMISKSKLAIFKHALLITLFIFLASLTAVAQYPVVAGVANSNSNGNTSSYTVSLPSGVQVNDLLIAIMGFRDRTFTTTTISFPSGWTQLVTRTAGSGQGIVFYKVATATEAGAASITVAGGTINARAAYTVYRIQNGTFLGNPEVAFINATAMVASAANPNPPSLTPSWGSKKNLWIAGAAGYRAASDPNTTTFIPSGFSNGTYSFDASATDVSSGSVSTATQNLEGATLDPGAFTLTATVHRAFTIAIQGVNLPVINSFLPTSGCLGDGTSVIITGTNFTGATAVNFFNGQTAAFTVNSATQITATIPAGAATGIINVTTPSGTAPSPSSFTVNPLPTATVNGQTNVSCYGGQDGTITILAGSGTGPYSYSVDGITFTPSAINPYVYSGLEANKPYRIKVQDSKGCISK